MQTLTVESYESKNPENYYFEFYEDKSEQWRWRLKSKNGNIIADSGQGYATRESCLNGIMIIQCVDSKTEVHEL